MDPYDQVVMQRKKTRKRVILMAVATIVLVAVIASVAVGVSKSKSSKSNGDDASHASSKTLQSLCQTTRYPDTCVSSVTSSKGYSSNISIQDLVILLLDVAMDQTQSGLSKLNSLSSVVKDPVQKVALQDCTELFNASISQLSDSKSNIQDSMKKLDFDSLADPSGDVQTWLSAALTNLETCLDGFSLSNSSDVKSEISNTTPNLQQVISNSLAAANKIASLFNVNNPSRRRLLMHTVDEEGYPHWLSAGNRRLLQSSSSSIKVNVVVDKKGSGKFEKIQDAIDKAPSKSEKRYVILVKAGVYYENVEVPKSKTNLMIIGQGIDKTIVSASKSVVDGSTTFRSATFATVGKGFIARDITFRNTAGPAKHQAVAVRSGADKSVFYRCKMIGAQDTLYVHSLRQFYTQCQIVGTVDFIFGNAVSYLQNCTITPTKPMLGQQCTVTAQGRTDPNMNTGIVIHRSQIYATRELEAVKNVTPTYLGRPWKQYSRTIVMVNYLGDIINPKGWLEWNATFALDTLVYREYKNSGPGAETSQRVKWKGFKVISNAKEAQQYSLSKFLGVSTPKKADVPYLTGL